MEDGEIEGPGSERQPLPDLELGSLELDDVLELDEDELNVLTSSGC